MYFMSRPAVMKAVSKIIDGFAGKARLVKSKTAAAQAALFGPACTVPGTRARISNAGTTAAFQAQTILL
jgi:hypothetical protein